MALLLAAPFAVACLKTLGGHLVDHRSLSCCTAGCRADVRTPVLRELSSSAASWAPAVNFLCERNTTLLQQIDLKILERVHTSVVFS